MRLEGSAPRVYALPPGADFPRAFAAGLALRLTGPEEAARTEIIVNARGAALAIGAALAAALRPSLLPRISLLTAAADRPDAPDLPPAVSPLRRLLSLSELVGGFLRRAGGLAPPSARFDLAAELAGLLDELQGWGVPFAALERLDVAGHSAHWQTMLRFLAILGEHWPGVLAETGGGGIDPEARRRHAVEGLAERWARDPPAHPVIVAGSTGSRAASALLMQAVARLPQGAVVLPGLDADLPGEVWGKLSPDHPQAALAGFIAGAGLDPLRLPGWLPGLAPPVPERARLISLALRPAPFTDAWRQAVPGLAPALAPATAGMSLIEAADEREEAAAIALALRDGIGLPGGAVLVTADRALARRVTAALARWDILPEDTAGRPLSLTPPGVFLRLVLGVAGGPPAPEALVALLKHPLCGGTGAARGAHMLLIGRLDLALRREAGPSVAPGWLALWAARQPGPEAAPWAGWLAAALAPLAEAGDLPLDTRVAALAGAAEMLSSGAVSSERLSARAGGAAPRLWLSADGAALWRLVSALGADGAGVMIGAADLSRLLDVLMAAENVPPADPGAAPDPRVAIIGPREARMLAAGRVVLGGLNDGAWPKLPGADPWLSRPMRAALGLPQPERQVGLSAHDFQIGANAPEVILSRTTRSGGAPTVAARWLTRLASLLEGSGAEGRSALAGMRSRGAAWCALAQRLDRPAAEVPPEPRAAPRPAAALRPLQLSVTEVETLIRDPYAVYARHVLGLRPLDPLGRPPDARDRGTALHAVLHAFARATPEGLPADAADLLLRLAEAHIGEDAPWPAERRLWRGQMLRAARWFLAGEAERRAGATPVGLEIRGERRVARPGGDGFLLTAKADRIDRAADGTLHLIDYKTGTPPTLKEIARFSRQLWLEAAIAAAGGFAGLPALPVARLSYLGLTGSGDGGRETVVEVEPEALARSWEQFEAFMAGWGREETAYVSRLRPRKTSDSGDYDHLARFGEWGDGSEEAEEA